MRYHNIFFAILRLYFWSIHMDKNFILATSFGFKLNSDFKSKVLPLGFCSSNMPHKDRRCDLPGCRIHEDREWSIYFWGLLTFLPPRMFSWWPTLPSLPGISGKEGKIPLPNSQGCYIKSQRDRICGHKHPQEQLRRSSRWLRLWLSPNWSTSLGFRQWGQSGWVSNYRNNFTTNTSCTTLVSTDTNSNTMPD